MWSEGGRVPHRSEKERENISDFTQKVENSECRFCYFKNFARQRIEHRGPKNKLVTDLNSLG